MRLAIACLTGLILGSAPLFFHSHAATPAKEPALQENFYGVHVSESRAWIVGYYGTILHSADRGQTWRMQSSPTRRALFSVRFIDPLKGWISGSYGTVLHTMDGGKNWRAQSVDTTEHLFASNWVDESHGWMVGTRGMTVRTSDSGRSWAAFSVPGDFTFSAVKFVNPLRGWLGGEFGVIFRTADGGKSWEKQKSPIEVSFASGASQNLFALLFTAPTVGYAFGLDGVVLKTIDGRRWEIARQRENTNGANPPTHHLFAAAAFNERISVVGERGTLLQFDSMNQWRQADLPIPRLSLNGIAFGSDGFGLAVGNRGLVLRSEDGGKTWHRLKINLQRSGKASHSAP
jgi:photosystem II stability/assembly factor-like uncharacterized protein